MSIITPESQTDDAEEPKAGTSASTQEAARIPQKTEHLSRVIRGLNHGSHALEEEDAQAPQPDTNTLENVVSAASAGLHLKQISTPFRYMFESLSSDYPFAHLNFEAPSTIVTALKALGNAMVEAGRPDPNGDSTIPAIYTYWGQFVDHDLTANTDRDVVIGITDGILDPLAPSTVVRDLKNLREPQLNLDSMYGRGPVPAGDLEDSDVPYNGDALAVVTSGLPGGPGATIQPQTDLPRHQAAGNGFTKGTARIGDGRNDENLIVAQLHGALLRFHNAVLDRMAGGLVVDLPDGDEPKHGFSMEYWKARRLVQWTYQWITVHDFLKRIVGRQMVDDLLDGTIDPFFAPTSEADTYMPLEFSIAGFRFGHSMIRGGYDWNENFGSPQPGEQAPNGAAPIATFEELFLFTGNGGGPVNFAGQLPRNWPARYERLTGHEPAAGRNARKIDTLLAGPLADMLNQGTDAHLSERVKRILKRLAVRNLVRGYRLSLPTGQAVAGALGVTPLTRDQILDGAQPSDLMRDTLIDGNFVDRTPLWFYILREAETVGGGNKLGPVGGRIVAETIIGQVTADPASFLNAGWDVETGVRFTASDGTDVAVKDVAGLLHVAGVHAAPAPAQEPA